MAKQAVIITDMIRDFLEPDGALYVGEQGRAIIPYVVQTVAEMRRQGARIIYLCDAHGQYDREFERFGRHAVKGSWGGELIAPLNQEPEDIRVAKTHYSGFYGTELEEVLRREGITEAHLLGVCTSICIMETARDLDDRGIKVVVHRRGVADLNPDDHEWALKRMEKLFQARVVP